MRTALWTSCLISGALLLVSGCGGFLAHCSDSNECDPQSYCNVPLGACFKRTGGATVPIIRIVVVDSAGLIVSGDAPSQSRVSIFLDAHCDESTLGGQTDTNSATTFSVHVPTTADAGTLSAFSANLSTGSLSVCSPFVTFP